MTVKVAKPKTLKAHVVKQKKARLKKPVKPHPVKVKPKNTTVVRYG